MNLAPKTFIQALKKHPIACSVPGCQGSSMVEELSQSTDRVKSFSLHCEECGHQEMLQGNAQYEPPWDEGSMMEIMEEHLLHLEPVCPYDHSPLHFHSLPNPRRKAKYRITCFFCGREEVIDWPPEEAKR